jgi:ribosome-associated protein
MPPAYTRRRLRGRRRRRSAPIDPVSHVAAVSSVSAEPVSVEPDASARSSTGPSRALALRLAEVISETPAADTLVLDIGPISPVADFFVLCSGENERQLRAIGRAILEEMADEGVRPERSEGTAAGGWILFDYGDVIVHVMDVELRAFYRLEELWSEAQTLLAIQ